MSFEIKKRILLVEDDFKLANVVTEYLESVPAKHVYAEATGYKVYHEPNGIRALSRIISEQPDLVLLDLMLPGMDGIQICRKVREKNSEGVSAYCGPIIMLTALSDEPHEITGIEAGADAYFPKPMRPRKLLAYIERFLSDAERRETEMNKALERYYIEVRENLATPSIINCGNLEIRVSDREVWMHGALAALFCQHYLDGIDGGDAAVGPLTVKTGKKVIFERKKDRDREDQTSVQLAIQEAIKTGGEELATLVDLTGAEYELLVYLAMRAGKIVAREQIYRDIRKIEWDGMDRSIDLRVTRLRRKLGDDARNPKIIKSVRGEGYLVSPAP